jgi:hypothetical protein
MQQAELCRQSRNGAFNQSQESLVALPGFEPAGSGSHSQPEFRFWLSSVRRSGERVWRRCGSWRWLAFLGDATGDRRFETESNLLIFGGRFRSYFSK